MFSKKKFKYLKEKKKYVLQAQVGPLCNAAILQFLLAHAVLLIATTVHLISCNPTPTLSGSFFATTLLFNYLGQTRLM